MQRRPRNRTPILRPTHNCHNLRQQFVVPPVNQTLFLFFLNVEVTPEVIELLGRIVFDVVSHGHQLID